MSKGAHIKVRRLGYTHHGIDMGDGTVVHFAGHPLKASKARIERTSMEAFAGSGRVIVINTPSSFSPEEICERALARVGERGYSLIANNCEHFATWCRTGVKRSPQVIKAAIQVTALATTVLIATLARPKSAKQKPNG